MLFDALCKFLLLLIVLIDVSQTVSYNRSKLQIKRRQLLDGTAKSGGVAPKPPGDLSVPMSSINVPTSLSSTIRLVPATIEERSIKEATNTQSKSKSGLIAAIAAPTGILGIIGALIGAFVYKKNNLNSAMTTAGGLFQTIFQSQKQ